MRSCSASRSARASEGGARRARLAALLAGVLASAAPAVAADEDAPVLVVSTERIMRETEAGETLRARERAARAEFESEMAERERALEAEEAELAELRAELDREAFERRAEAFDRRVRAARRAGQRRAAEIQRAFRRARESLRAEIAPILIDILQGRGADIVLDSGTILVAAPSVDITEEVIERFDAEVAPPAIDLPPFEGPPREAGDPAPGEAAE